MGAAASSWLSSSHFSSEELESLLAFFWRFDLLFAQSEPESDLEFADFVTLVGFFRFLASDNRSCVQNNYGFLHCVNHPLALAALYKGVIAL